jgi:hypothetical protein
VALIFPKKKKNPKNPWLHRVASYVYRRLLCAGEREREPTGKQTMEPEMTVSVMMTRHIGS